jgi:hypothetical protein
MGRRYPFRYQKVSRVFLSRQTTFTTPRDDVQQRQHASIYDGRLPRFNWQPYVFADTFLGHNGGDIIHRQLPGI